MINLFIIQTMPKGFFNGVLIAMISCLHLNGQQLLFRNYSFREGLKTYNIYKTLQDKYGFIWVVTQDGAYRFNGRNFEVFKKNTIGPGSLNGVAFMDMAQGNDSSILFAGYNTGIEKMVLTDLQVQPFASQLPNLWFKKIYVDSSGTTWVGGMEYLAWKKNNEDNYQVLQSIPEFKGELDISFIRPLHGHFIAIGIQRYGIVFFDTRNQKIVAKYPLTKQAFGDRPCEYFEFYTEGVDSVYAITSAGIVRGRFNENGWIADQLYPDNIFKGRIINGIIRDKNQRFWIATNSGLILFDTQRKISRIFTAEKDKKYRLLDNSINHLMIDSQNNLWISTSTSLQRLNLDTSFFRYFSGDLPGSDPMDHIFSLIRKNDNEVFATGTTGLFHTDLNSAKTIRIRGSEFLGTVHHLEPIDPDLWVMATQRGMFGFNPKTSEISREALLKRYPEWSDHIEHYFNNVYHQETVSYWASEEREGLFRWDRQNHSILQFKNGKDRSAGLPENHIHNLRKDRDGNLWLLMDNSIALFDTKTDTVKKVIAYDPSRNSDSGFNKDIYFDMVDDGRELWFGTFGGGLNSISKTDGRWKYITEKDGLCNNVVYSILPENDSIIWVSTNSGLSRVQVNSKECTNYFIEDGLQDNSFDEKGSLQIGNRLYFGGINGFTEIELDKVRTKLDHFPVYCYKIEYYTGNSRNVINRLSWNEQTLPAGTRIVTMHLAALSFAKNQKIRFSYRIDGLQEDFIDVDETNTITLSALSYGNYSISIRYRQEDGSFGTNQIRMQFHIQPRWFQTWWFKASILLILAGVLYGIYLNRIAQLKREEKMRRKIAGDLHDDIGSTLNSIKVFTNLSLSKPGDTGYLQQIKEQTQNAIISVRDLMWVLNDKMDTVGDVIARFDQFAGTLAQARRIELEKNIAPEISSMHLKKDVKRNLYLILKEAFNNTVKYSEADKFGYAIQSGSQGRPCLIIKDNGKGFDVNAETEGYGLKNMKERADQINYDIEIKSSPGGGTSIILRAT